MINKKHQDNYLHQSLTVLKILHKKAALDKKLDYQLK